MYNKFLLILLFFVMSLMSVAQMGFKEGYVVNNRNEKIDCLIRNVGNEESTSNYEYRLKGSKEIESIALSKIEEFGIDNEFKCIRALILVDVSRDYISNVKDTIIEWEEGHAFLKVLVEGELASLYSYYDQGKTFFFFSTGDNLIEPLVYKKYYLSITPTVVNQIFYNNTYQEQLSQYLACEDFADVSKVSYTKKDLVKYFINYHTCKHAESHQFKDAHVKKGILLIKPVLNLNKTQLGIHDLIDAAPKVFFVKENSVSFGTEIEYILPFNNYKWSVFTEANYLSYATKELLISNILNPQLYDGYSIDYKSMEFPVGLSFYMHLNQNHRFYFRVAIAPHYIFTDSYITFNGGHKYEFSSSSRFLLGTGYNFHNLGIEFRYYSPLNITQNIYKRSSDLTQVSLKISYAFKLFGEKGFR